MGVALVLRSEVPSVVAGSHVTGFMPFQEYPLLPKEMAGMLMPLNNPRGLPWSTFVGVLGGTGQTAWMAWEEFAKAKKVSSLSTHFTWLYFVEGRC
jgi:NADPH-dependent curcumin reductase CurA